MTFICLAEKILNFLITYRLRTYSKMKEQERPNRRVVGPKKTSSATKSRTCTPAEISRIIEETRNLRVVLERIDVRPLNYRNLQAFQANNQPNVRGRLFRQEGGAIQPIVELLALIMERINMAARLLRLVMFGNFRNF